jgi:hypothetical protein
MCALTSWLAWQAVSLASHCPLLFVVVKATIAVFTTPGKLWRALAAGIREGLTTEFLPEIPTRDEMIVEIQAARARFDATRNQNPADLRFLLLGLFCTSTSDSFKIAGDTLALLHARKASRASLNEHDKSATRISSLASPADGKTGDQ